MKEFPLLFSGAMVRAILSGAKTQTRRPARQAAPARPPCAPGDIAWVRETWAAFTKPHPEYGDCDLIDWCSPSAMRAAERWVELADVVYAADKENSPAKWRPSIHMPRWACRITLPIVEVRIERVQDITEEDARAEGVAPFTKDPEGDCWADGKYTTAFQYLWGEINGWEGAANPRATWPSNPWVWVLRWEKAKVRK